MALPLNRRAFLRGSGVCLALPWLDAMAPRSQAAADRAKPRRMVCIQTNMGILPQFFFPEKDGRDYEPTPYLKLLDKHLGNLTVFSGVSHPDVDGGHAAEKVFLSAAPHPGSPTFRNSISIDQFAAEQVGTATRFPTLTLASTGEANRSLSITRAGIAIPEERSPSKLYQQLFVNAKADEVERRVRDLQKGRSLLDFVADGSQRLQQKVGPRDRERLDQYCTSVRDLEQRMVRLEDWERKPKPSVTAPAPQDIADPQLFVERAKLMLDMIRLALETDSSRLITFFLDAVVIHNITHHGNRPETLAELRGHEEREFKILNDFLTSLTEIREEGETMLDRTMVLYGSALGNANSHSTQNMPMLLSGGDFKHGQHLAFDTKPGRNYPLTNLYVSMLQRLGIETDRFASSTGTMRGLELRG